MTMACRHGLHWRPSERPCRTAAEAASETFRCEMFGAALRQRSRVREQPVVRPHRWRSQGTLGHKVEVIGITSDTKLNKSDSFRSAIGSSTQEKATLTVSSVKMIAAKCP